MPDNPRIEELQRRVQKDPASIAFAQLAEEYRRTGNYEEAVRVCRTGLAKHPSYLSARVTLGRALIELHQYDEAQTELDYVLRSAPENLAAIRGRAEIHQRRGELEEALKQYQAALGIAKHDPDLEESVHELSRQLGAAPPATAPPLPPPLPRSVAPVETEVRAGADEERPGDLPPIPAETPPAETFELETGERTPAAPSPVLSPELEAAADEFTKALQALDALSIDLPAPAAAPEPLDLPEVKPAVDDRLVPAEDWENAGFNAAPPAADKLAAAPPTPPDPVLDELEAWLDGIVADRGTRAADKKS